MFHTVVAAAAAAGSPLLLLLGLHVDDAIADAVEPSHLLASNRTRIVLRGATPSQRAQVLLGLLEVFLCPGQNPGHRPSRSCEMGGGVSNDEFFAAS
ncbi:hypothetical protein RRF57_002925 [Xylaria bambusicola]|uniref:Secreted protein n=1 Tax=Xylaria bambusicola TaxID=326684 RepID=A0AAN7U710_9PEZI